MIEWVRGQFGFSVLLAAGLFGMILTAVAYAVLLERRVAAWVQDRRGPNRVGPFGLLQPLADGVKALLKEEFIPARADRPMFYLAPCLAFGVAAVGFAVIPWAGPLDLGGAAPVQVQVASVDIGLLYLLGVGALGVYGVVLAGWASNNKYAFYGGMRAAAQMLSYEVPMGLAILVVVATTGCLRLEDMVAGPTGQIATAWNLLLHPLAFLIFLVTAFAETNRTPFDLAECEQELIGGYQTEYSSMKFSLFFLGEYTHVITASAFTAVMFLGGWEPFPFSRRPGWAWLDWLNGDPSPPAAGLRFAITLAKTAGIVFLFILVRWTLPRFRFDQLMGLCWRGLVPAGLALACWAGLLVWLGRPQSLWAPLGDVMIAAAALGWTAWRDRPGAAGRVNLPPVEAT